MIKKIFLIIGSIIFFTGCLRDIPTPNERKLNALSLIENKNFQIKTFKTKNFDIFTIENLDIQSKNKECKNMKVYIEGDGLAWITKSIISSNPTPINPIALKLMLQDKSTCTIYIARPCQYLDSKNCEKKYWTSHRFNQKVIDSISKVLDNIKTSKQNKTFTLIGYSGGGAVATVLSALRKDVKVLVTIAGNIDTKEWTDFHNISPLNGSLNPADFTNDLEYIKQYHLIGLKDTIIPKEIFYSYKSKFKNKKNIKHFFFDTNHSKDWEKIYIEFMKF